MGRPQTIDRHKVLDAAEKIVEKEGVAKLSIDAVAKAAGISKGGVQYAFGNRDGLIDAMLNRWDKDFDTEVAAIVGPDPTPNEAIAGHVEATSRFNAKIQSRAAVMMTVLVQNTGQIKKARVWYRRQIEKLDLSTTEGRQARLAFLATEGAYMLRSFGFLRMHDDEWQDIFEDIRQLLEMPADKNKGL